MTAILKFFIVFLLVVLCSHALHEGAHLLACFILKCKVVDFKVLFFSLSRGKQPGFRFSVKGSNHCSFSCADKKKALWVTVMGPLVNLLLGVILVLTALGSHPNWGVLAGGIYNLIICVYNLLPRVGGDGALISELLKEL